ncbi:MAG: protoheme IX farnesyltransferase [Legionellales bacterium]|nr:protoheme IX farnesyltransferase [Legionellales bacterium]|tara:strand:- start:13562 stop:14461 length:900 start_codon:yes stop_codon:yes gene_type:complete
MTTLTESHYNNSVKATWRDYLELCKPRVVMLMVLTSIVGMCLATQGAVPLVPLIIGNIGIALAACGAAAVNHVADKHIDKLMARTKNRPMVKDKIAPRQCLLFAGVLCAASMILLVSMVNTLTAILTFASMIGYAGVYTLYLKYATPQNIVIGGLAGAAPPLLGWTAVTGQVSPEALMLVLIIFVWTPPHFWALAIHRYDDYKNADVPMLPATHGIRYTKVQILLYTVLLIAVTLLPYVAGMSGLLYLIGVMALNARFLYWAIKLFRTTGPDRTAFLTFKYSIVYLGLLFIVLLLDHYI